MKKHIAFHHFVPAMILPVIVFWRTELFLTGRRRSQVLAVTALCIFTSIVLSLTVHFGADQSNRIIGAAIEDKMIGYDIMNPSGIQPSTP